MPTWVAVLGMIVSAVLACLSYAGVREAKRTGHARFFFWRLRNWGVREQSPGFFKFVLFCDYYRTAFLALCAIVFSIYLFNSLGVI